MRRAVLLGLSVAFLSTWPTSTPANAGELWARLRGHAHHTGQPAYWEGNPKRQAAAPPGPHRYPGYNAAQAPWYGYGFGVPTYNWGYFGARYRSATLSHKGYYGDFTQWGYRRGY